MDASKVGNVRTPPPYQPVEKSHPVESIKPKKTEVTDKTAQENHVQAAEPPKNQKSNSAKPSAAGEINVTA